VGPAAIEFDTQRRIQQLRMRARAALASLPARHRAYLDAYTAGVNAGLDDLSAWPPEYLVLRQAPTRWRAEDSMLVVLALYTMLSNNDSYERHNGAMRDVLPPELFEFLTPRTARDDRPVSARDAADPTGGYEPVPIPGPDVVDLRNTTYDGSLDIVRQPLSPPGSNNWAVGGGRAGRPALLANDPHLTLRIPNVFHRAELYWNEGEQRGVGIAGLPGILIGANRFVGWAATVSYADQADFVVIDVIADDPDRYVTPEGSEAFGIERESIVVAGLSEPIEAAIRTTRWGPVVDEDHAGRPLVLRAKWLDADGFDLRLLDIAETRSSEEAIELLRAWRGPSMNWLTADVAGQIGWAVNGPVPRRVGFDGSVPERWGNGGFGWRGEAALPWTITSGNDSLYSANNRQLSMPDAAALGRFALPPHRAMTIAAALESGDVSDEPSSLALQLDTRVGAYDLLQTTALTSVAPDEIDPLLARARRAIAEWDGTADVDSTALPILDLFYDRLLERLLGTMLLNVRAADDRFIYRWTLADEALRRVLDERPAHLLPRGFADWDTYLRDILRESIAALDATDALPRWGDVNRLDIAHPLGGVPALGPFTRWENFELPGNALSVRVAQPSFGAVIRMSIRPGSPETGIMQFAGGQSGHFLSPHYSDQLADWVDGVPTPFMAGPAQHAYVLRPVP
jgi:penicillin amidase